MEHIIFQKEDVRFSGFWMRFLAYLFDSIIISIVSFIPAFIFGFIGSFMGMATESDVVLTISAWLVYIVVIVSNVWYFAGFHASKFQATPGKMLLGIKVADVNGNRIRFWRGVGRYFASVLSGFILCIGYIMAGIHPQKRSLHDVMAGTYVIHSNGNLTTKSEEFAHAE